MPLTDRVKQILSWYGSDNPGRARQPRAHAESRHARRHRQDGHPPGRPGLRARRRALVRAEPRRATIPTTTPARDRLRLQRVRGAARLPRGGRRQVRRADPAHPEAEQLRHAREDRPAVQRGHRLGEGRACASAAPRSATRSTRARARATAMYEDLRELILEAKAVGLPTVALGLPARRGPLEGRRDGGRRRGVRGADLRAARRARHQDQAAEGLTSSRPRRRRSSRSTTSRRRRSPTACATACRAHSTASASSSSRAARRRARTSCSTRSKSSPKGGAFGSIMGRNAFQRPRAGGHQAPCTT